MAVEVADIVADEDDEGVLVEVSLAVCGSRRQYYPISDQAAGTLRCCSSSTVSLY